MLRLALLLILLIVVARAFWRVVDGIVAGFSGGARSQSSSQHAAQMVRDPVCGTFVLPERALMVRDGPRQLYFCSAACRDKYERRSA